MIDTTRISPTPAELAEVLGQAVALHDHDRDAAAALTEARNRRAFAPRHRPA